MRKRTLAILFVAAFLFRLAVAAESGMFERIIRTETEGIALNVANSGQYALYFSPTAYDTPIFPFFLAGLFRLFGSGSLDLALNVILACLVCSLRCVLVPMFAIEAGLEPGAALIAGWIGVLYIGALETEVRPGLDGPFVALALLGLLWAALRIWRSGSWRTRTHWGYFLFCGFAALFNPSVLPVIAGILVAGAIACPAAARQRYFGQAALAVAGVVIFIAPWAIRNDLTLGAPILTRSNFGTEFWVSNGPDRTFDHPYNYGTYHPSQNPEEARRVGELGEVEYNRLKFAEGLEWVRSDPGAYLSLTAIRFVSWWFPPRPLILLPLKLVISLLAFAGLRMMFRVSPIAAWLIVITWITFPDIYYLVQWSSRYRYPMDWQLLLCASLAIYAGWQALIRARRKTSPDLPAIAGTV